MSHLRSQSCDVRAARCRVGGCGPPGGPDPAGASFLVTKHLTGAADGLEAAAIDLGQLGGGELIEVDPSGRVLRQGRPLGLTEAPPVLLVLPRADDLLLGHRSLRFSFAT